MTLKSTGPIYRINGIMDQDFYTDEIPYGVLRLYIEENAPEDWIFQVFFCLV
jgi:hypothetical protein